MNNIINKKVYQFMNIAFILSIVSIIITGVLKLLFNIDIFDMEINNKISNFFLFKNLTIQHILLQISLMFNYTLIIAITNKTKITSVVNKTWILLILTWLVNLLSRETAFYMTTLIGIIINIVYCYRINIKSVKSILISSCKLILISFLLLIYQYITILIRLNHIPTPNETFSFYEQVIYLMDMYIIMLLYYTKQRKDALI